MLALTFCTNIPLPLYLNRVPMASGAGPLLAVGNPSVAFNAAAVWVDQLTAQIAILGLLDENGHRWETRLFWLSG